MMLCACRWGEQLGKDRLGRSHLCTALTGSPWQKLSKLPLKQICRSKGLSVGTGHSVRSSRSMDSMFQGVRVCLCNAYDLEVLPRLDVKIQLMRQ